MAESKSNNIGAARFFRNLVNSHSFDVVVMGVIIFQAIVLAVEATPFLFGAEGSDSGSENMNIFTTIHSMVVAIFVVEAGMRIVALYPRPLDYFKSGWNSFDFAIIVLSLIPVAGQFSTVARLIRLLRVTRLVTKSKELRAVVSTLFRSIPSIFNIMILLSMFFFIYAVTGYHLFHRVDPEHWSSFPVALVTLFQIITLEGWVNIMQPIVDELGLIYWLYFASFIMIGTFIIINLFISVIVRKSEEAYRQLQRESGSPITQQEISEEIREIRRILEELHDRLDQQTNIERKGSGRSS